MATNRNYQSVVKKLKKQLRLIQRKEAQGKAKLRVALKKIHKMSLSYKRKFNTKVRAIQSKAGVAQASTYTKMAADLQRQLTKSIANKGRKLCAAINLLEKKQISQVVKGLAKKGKKTSRPKKKVRSKKKSTKRNRKR